MDTNLVVVRPFGGFGRGHLISDPARVAEILSGENSLDVVRVAVPREGALASTGGK